MLVKLPPATTSILSGLSATDKNRNRQRRARKEEEKGKRQEKKKNSIPKRGCHEVWHSSWCQRVCALRLPISRGRDWITQQKKGETSLFLSLPISSPIKYSPAHIGQPNSLVSRSVICSLVHSMEHVGFYYLLSSVCHSRKVLENNKSGLFGIPHEALTLCFPTLG